MPRIIDYKHADCTLFRTPIVSFTSVKDSLDSALAKAWKDGYSPQNALDEIINNKKFVGGMSKELEKHLGFKRNNLIQAAKSEKEKLREAALKKYQEKTSSISERYKVRSGETLSRHNQYSQNLDSQLEEYSASQEKLRELRERARESLDKIGGEDGYKRLLRINNLVNEGGDEISSNSETPRPKKNLENTIKFVKSEIILDPLKVSEIETFTPETIEEEVPFYKRWYNSITSIFSKVKIEDGGPFD